MIEQPTIFPSDDDLKAAMDLADEFDRQRHCGWNNGQNLCEYREQPVYQATDIKQISSLGWQCWGTPRELALLHTLRPCKHCGGDTLFKSNYQIGCCSCLGDDCEDCQEGGCQNLAENANLPDAITRWNLHYGDEGPRGRVEVVG